MFVSQQIQESIQKTSIFLFQRRFRTAPIGTGTHGPWTMRLRQACICFDKKGHARHTHFDFFLEMACEQIISEMAKWDATFQELMEEGDVFNADLQWVITEFK